VSEETLDQTFRENLPAALALINSAGFSRAPGDLKVCANAATQTVQVVQHYGDVFKDWTLGVAEPEPR